MALSAADEIARQKELEDRIKAPCLWGRVPSGIRFEDLQDKRYEDAIRLLKKHYLNDEITYRSLKISEDVEGKEEFIHNARIWMKDKMSIVAVKEDTDKLVGVLLIRIQEKCSFSRTFSRVKLTYNPLYSQIMSFYNEIERSVDLFQELDVRKYFKFYVLALKNRYRHRGIGKQMYKAAIELAKSATVPAVAGIFTTSRSQAIVEDLGFMKFNEIYYNRYLKDGQIVFTNCGEGNYGAALWAYRIPDVIEPMELVPVHSSRFSVPIPAIDEKDNKNDKDEGEVDGD